MRTAKLPAGRGPWMARVNPTLSATMTKAPVTGAFFAARRPDHAQRSRVVSRYLMRIPPLELPMRRILTVVFMLVTATAQAADFKLSSPDIDPAKPLPQRFEFSGFGCKGENRSPELRWSGAPAGTKSYAVTVYDPDAPTGSGWWHWLVVDVPANVEGLTANAGAVDGSALPAPAKHVRTDFGGPGFGGACPPAGDKPHRYVFTVFALKVESLGLPDNATAAMAGFMMRANALDQASFTVRYGR